MSEFTPASYLRVVDGVCGDCALPMVVDYCPTCALYWEAGTSDAYVWVESSKVVAGGVVGKAKVTFTRLQMDAYLGK